MCVSSQEGHEFIVDRDAVMASGTIRTLLTGPGQQHMHIKLLSPPTPTPDTLVWCFEHVVLTCTDMLHNFLCVYI